MRGSKLIALGALVFASASCATSPAVHARVPERAVSGPSSQAPVRTAISASFAPSPTGPDVEDANVQALPSTGALLENPAALSRFFERLAQAESGEATNDVRIVQFGDSHTQPDLGTGAVRRALQARFGDGGRGFVPLMNPTGTWLQSGVHAGFAREWKVARMKMKKGKLTGDGLYGLGGVSAVSTAKGAELWLEVPATSRIELAYLEQPRGGTFDVMIDGARAARISSAHAEARSAFRAFDVPEAPHRIDLVPVGDGEARVFGVMLDRTAAGVTLDALGIGGARASGILDWREAHFAEQLRHRAPDLVVLAYGTNEAGYEVSIPAYERQLSEVIARIARSAPEASCVLLGPPDWVTDTGEGYMTPPILLDVIGAQKRVAVAKGCAYFSQFDAMGGEQSMAAWADATPPLGRQDRVHLTRAGYEILGATFARDVLAAYDAWRSASNAPSASR